MVEREQAAPQQAGSRRNRSGAQLAAILIVMLLGMGLRLYALDQNALWRDELQTLHQSTRDSLTEIFEAVRVSVHPPGHNLIIHYLVGSFGDSELVLRLPSALAGVLSIALFFKIGALLFSYREGLYAAAFLAVLRVPIYYSQEARPYGLLLFATLLATLFWILLIKKFYQGARPSIYIILGYIISAIFASYMHYYGLYLIALQGLAAALFFIKRPKLLLFIFLLYAPIVIAFLPWVSAASYQFNRGPTWIRPPKGNTILGYFEFLFNNSRAMLILFVVFCLLLIVVTAFRYFRYRSEPHARSMPISPDLFVVLWLLVPIAGVYLMAIASVPTLTNRNLIICLPAALLLLARGITQLPLRQQWRSAVASTVFLLFLLNLFFGVQYYSRPQKPEMRAAAQYILDHSQEYENALIVGYRIGWYNYYLRRGDSGLKVNLVLPTRETDITRVQKAIKKRNVEYVWFMHALSTGPSDELIASFDENLERIDHQSFYRADVWLYKTK